MSNSRWDKMFTIPSLGTQVYMATAAILLIMGGTLFFSIFTQARLENDVQSILDQRIAAMEAALELKEAVISHDNSVFRYLSTKRPKHRLEAEQLRKTIQLKTGILDTLSPNPAIRERTRILKKEIPKYFKFAREVIAFSDSADLETRPGLFEAAAWARSQPVHRQELSILSLEGESRLDKLLAVCDEVLVFNRAALYQTRLELDQSLRRTSKALFWVLGLGSAFILWLALGLANSFRTSFKSLMEGVRQMQQGHDPADIPVYSGGDLAELAESFNRMARTVREQKERLTQEALMDPLTNVFNQRQFRRLLQNEFERAKRTGLPLSLLMVDVDHFKNFNDTQGHELGNEILKKIAQVILETLRKVDLLCRYGGDEFAVILPNAAGTEAATTATRLVESVRHAAFPGLHVFPGGKVTLSVGGATYPGQAVTTDDLVEKADNALYQAKKEGRDRVSWYKMEPDIRPT